MRISLGDCAKNTGSTTKEEKPGTPAGMQLERPRGDRHGLGRVAGPTAIIGIGDAGELLGERVQHGKGGYPEGPHSSYDPAGSHGRRSLPGTNPGVRHPPAGIRSFNDTQGSSTYGR